ncbi:ATPase [Sulfurimonas sp. MAG313]|nr:DUF234 domain-containing protein [Sulfurimonas sp. MAG313]MDF1880778.1 ATPase [Sulfurimonas sp. MAG313]
MSKFPSILTQFRSFYFQNKPENIEEAIEYFSVFGGMGWTVNMTDDLEEIIEQKVLTNYRYIHGDTTKITQSNKLHHALLSAIATGDRREHSAFKKAQTGRPEGEESIDFLVDNDLLDRDKPQAKPLDSKEEVSEKLLFTLPFMRFWFAAISPYYKSIKEGDYTEFTQAWKNTKPEFSNFIYERLVLELIKKNFEKTDPIQKIGSYWDSDNNLDILAKTKSGKVIAGAWKFSKAKAKKSELTKLKETCKAIDLPADIFIIFSKSGFSNELKNEKGESLRLYTLKNLNTLVQDLKSSDLIDNTNKMY